MFIKNKYYKWYYNIIERAEHRICSPNDYLEKHHIIPKSLGGSNLKENIVKLTAKEHFVCHSLLTKMVIDPVLCAKMHLARFRMSHSGKNHERIRISSNLYQKLRRENAKAISVLRKGKPGRKHTEEEKARRSIARKGYRLSDETKEKLRLAHLGRKHSAETKEKFKTRVSNRIGAVLTETHKLAISNANKRRHLIK
jgi:NUMOD3 motif